METLNLTETLRRVHEHFVLDGKPPSVNPEKPQFCAFHGQFDGQPSCCALGLFDRDRILEGELFDVPETEGRDAYLLKVVFEYPRGEPFADWELDFLRDIVRIHDDGFFYCKQAFEREFNISKGSFDFSEVFEDKTKKDWLLQSFRAEVQDLVDDVAHHHHLTL